MRLKIHFEWSRNNMLHCHGGEFDSMPMRDDILKAEIKGSEIKMQCRKSLFIIRVLIKKQNKSQPRNFSRAYV